MAETMLRSQPLAGRSGLGKTRTERAVQEAQRHQQATHLGYAQCSHATCSVPVSRVLCHHGTLACRNIQSIVDPEHPQGENMQLPYLREFEQSAAIWTCFQPLQGRPSMGHAAPSETGHVPLVAGSLPIAAAGACCPPSNRDRPEPRPDKQVRPDKCMCTVLPTTTCSSV